MWDLDAYVRLKNNNSFAVLLPPEKVNRERWSKQLLGRDNDLLFPEALILF
jgi:hypothetical protein